MLRIAIERAGVRGQSVGASLSRDLLILALFTAAARPIAAFVPRQRLQVVGQLLTRNSALSDLAVLAEGDKLWMLSP